MKLLKLSIMFSFVFALLAVSAAPADASFRIKIRANGKDSYNKVEVKKFIKTSFEQENEKDVDTDVELGAETGENESEDNTGTGTELTSGKVDLDLTIVNDGDYNDLVVDPCCEEVEPLGEVVIKDNGKDSTNKVEVVNSSFFSLEQENESDVDNKVKIKVGTGENESEGNTGGSTTIKSGKVSLKLKIKNLGNINIANIGSCCQVAE